MKKFFEPKISPGGPASGKEEVFVVLIAHRAAVYADALKRIV